MKSTFKRILGVLLAMTMLTALLIPVSASTYPDGAVILDTEAKATQSADTNSLFGIKTQGTMGKDSAAPHILWKNGVLEFKSDAKCNTMLFLKNFPKGIDSYTVEVDLTVPTLAGNTLLSIGINADGTWTNGYFLQYKNETSNNVSLNNGTGVPSKPWGPGSTYENGGKNFTYTAGTVMTLKLTVTPELVRGYLGGKEVGHIETSKLSIQSGVPAIGLRGGHTVTLNSMKVYAGVTAPLAEKQVGLDSNLAFYGHQRSLAAKETFDLRFLSQIKVTDAYNAVGFDISVVNAEGTEVKHFDKASNTVYKKVTGTVDGVPSEYLPDEAFSFLYALTLTGIPSNLGVLTFHVTPYAVTADGVTVYYPPYSVTYNGSAVQP